MKKEEKALLYQDLCSRLPYGIKVNRGGHDYSINLENFSHFLEISEDEEFKPYLRPMSEITGPEIIKLQKINYQFSFNRFDNLAYVGAADDGFCSVQDMGLILSFLNSRYLDYRGLIDKGLALKAPEGMYKF